MIPGKKLKNLPVKCILKGIASPRLQLFSWTILDRTIVVFEALPHWAFGRSKPAGGDGDWGENF